VSLDHAIETLRTASSAPGGVPDVPMTGLEALVAGALAALPTGAWWVPGQREHGGAVLREVPAERVSAWRGARPYKVAPASAAPALRALHAVGLARASSGPALVHLGTGSIADGAFTEALNLAVLLQAQAIFLVAELPLDHRAPVGPQSVASAATLAKAYGIPVHTADGTDAASVQAAVSLALQAGGPAVITASLPTPGAPS